MERRDFLSAAGLVTFLLAGCSGDGNEDEPSDEEDSLTDTETETLSPTATPTPTATSVSMVATSGSPLNDDGEYTLQEFIYNAEHADVDFEPQIERVAIVNNRVRVRYEGHAIQSSGLEQLAAILGSYVDYIQYNEDAGRLVVTRVDAFSDPIERVYCKREWAETYIDDESVTAGEFVNKVYGTLEYL